MNISIVLCQKKILKKYSGKNRQQNRHFSNGTKRIKYEKKVNRRSWNGRYHFNFKYHFHWVLVRKNNGEKYLDTYLNQQQSVKVFVSDEYFEGQFTHTSYLKRIIFYKGVFGGSTDYIFLDTYSNKYFRIMRFDNYGEETDFAQTYKIENHYLYVMVDSVQYNDPTYGTLENPYIVFSYRGIGKKLMMTIDLDEKGEDGFYLQKEVPLAPSEEEYRYNAEQYLTYVMPKKEFKKRFEE